MGELKELVGAAVQIENLRVFLKQTFQLIGRNRFHFLTNKYVDAVLDFFPNFYWDAFE